MTNDVRLLENKTLQKWRHKKGYSQKELAEMLGISRTTYIGYERRGRMPTAYVVLQLARFLGVPATDVYESFEQGDGYIQLLDFSIPGSVQIKEEALVE